MKLLKRLGLDIGQVPNSIVSRFPAAPGGRDVYLRFCQSRGEGGGILSFVRYC